MKKIALITIIGGLILGMIRCNDVRAQGITTGPSCRIVSKASCSDYSASNPADLPSYEKMCPQFGGEWSVYGCPSPGPCRNDQQGIKICKM